MRGLGPPRLLCLLWGGGVGKTAAGSAVSGYGQMGLKAGGPQQVPWAHGEAAQSSSGSRVGEFPA